VTGRAIIAFVLLAGCSHRSGAERAPAQPDALIPVEASAPSSPADAAHPQLCGAVCNTLPPACPTPDCATRCESMLSAATCLAESLALFDCQSRVSPGDYLCEDGRPRLKETVCMAEARAWIHCSLNQP
jgi:hypothetical protein